MRKEVFIYAVVSLLGPRLMRSLHALVSSRPCVSEVAKVAANWPSVSR